MKKSRKVIGIVFSCLFVLVAMSCGDDNALGGESIVLDTNTPNTQVLQANQTNARIVFKAKDKWTVSVLFDSNSNTVGDAGWLRMNAYWGDAGTNVLMLSADENLTCKEREARILITCGKTLLTIKVCQKAGNSEEADSVFIREHQIRKITGWEQGTEFFCEFSYDSLNRLSKMYECVFHVESKEVSSEITWHWNYGKDKVSVNMQSREYANCNFIGSSNIVGSANLNGNGYVAHYEGSGDNGDWSNCSVSYENERVSRIVGEQYSLSWILAYSVSETWNWYNGNLTGMHTSEGDLRVEYTDIRNNNSIDLPMLVSPLSFIGLAVGSVFYRPFFIAGLMGHRSLYMPKRYSRTYGAADIIYEQKPDGRVSKVSVASHGDILNYYTITYED